MDLEMCTYGKMSAALYEKEKKQRYHTLRHMSGLKYCVDKDATLICQYKLNYCMR